MLKAVILDYQSLAPDDLDAGALWQLPIEWTLFDYTDAESTESRLANQDIVLSNKVVISEELLRKNPQIRLIVILATGTNNVDLKVAGELGIPVCNIVGYSTESVVQHTFALLLTLQTRLIDYHQAVRDGAWCQSRFFGLLTYPIREVAGKTLGIIGYGAIGKRVGQVAEAMGMRVIVAQSLLPAKKENGEYGTEQVSRVSLGQLYAEADIISIHCPLSAYSRNLVGASAFAQMKPDAVLLNLGRGGIVNEEALAMALKNGTIRAAATDVLEQEPPQQSHLLLDDSIPGLIVTPHIAWASREARQELLDQVVNILQSFTQGTLINQVKAS